ncbi:MAG TPA: pyridoxamine 5'-phosphate oxidase family protein [Clostridia bacterium]|nr:pyridoxamine 5'-phosphate oxidase family protein [Clostridia bacterium]
MSKIRNTSGILEREVSKLRRYEFFNRLEGIIAEIGTAILANIDEDGTPRMRWMTPATLKGRPGFIYCVGAGNSKKVKGLRINPKAEWMIQSKNLDCIINIKGTVNILDNPSIRTEILHTIGPRLGMFWKTNLEDTEFVVLETVMDEAIFFEPMLCKSKRVSFREGDE